MPNFDVVPRVDHKFDPRFDLEKNWEMVEENVKECQERGVIVTPLTVFSNEGRIIGWVMSGWKAPPPKILYECKAPTEPNYIPDYSI